MPIIPINPQSAAAGSPDRGPRRTPRARTSLPAGTPPVRPSGKQRHAISGKQKAMYWRAWADARAVLIRSGNYSPREADAYRHEIHLQALGASVSSKDLTNRQLDLVLAAFAAIARPDDLTAQMDGPAGTRRRTLYALKDLANGREEYIAEICGSCFGHAQWQRLSDSDLQKLRMTMERRVTRKEAAASGGMAKPECQNPNSEANPHNATQPSSPLTQKGQSND